jgi:hypothetical protein
MTTPDNHQPDRKVSTLQARSGELAADPISAPGPEAGQHVQAYWARADAYIVAAANPDPAAEPPQPDAEAPEAQI